MDELVKAIGKTKIKQLTERIVELETIIKNYDILLEAKDVCIGALKETIRLMTEANERLTGGENVDKA